MPWSRINKFLEEVGSAEDNGQFVQRVMAALPPLIPFDLHCVFGVVRPDGQLSVDKTVVESRKWLEHFRDRYWNRVPDISREPGVRTRSVDWDHYLDTEYSADFMKPQSIRYSLGFPALGVCPDGDVGTFAVNRSRRSRPFNERERQIAEILHPHLSNFYRALARPRTRFPSTHLRDRCGLTARESEIVDMVLCGLSNRMIAFKLGISERTVEAHCLHVYNKVGVRDRIGLLTYVLARMQTS